MEWILELVLIVLLAATLFHAVRLERALGVLKRDRATLQELVTGFNASTRAAEQGIARLKGTADGAGRTLARQLEAAQRLRDDLSFLSDRGDKLADRLEKAVRGARPLMQEPPVPPPGPVVRSLMGNAPLVAAAGVAPAVEAPATGAPADGQGRSRAERDLLRALRLGR